MKCKYCDGKGYAYVRTAPNPITGYGYKRVCDYCHGTGEIKQTEQEWLQTCNTEQLAEKLTDFSFWLVPTIPTEDKREQIRKKIVMWLKQPH